MKIYEFWHFILILMLPSYDTKVFLHKKIKQMIKSLLFTIFSVFFLSSLSIGQTFVNPAAAGLGDGSSWEKIEIEMTKCDVRCANCHRILHHEERNGS